MSGITSGTGVFSGINSQQIIEQLLAIDARPKTAAQNRIKALQTTQAAYLDLNSRLSSLKTSAQSFNVNNLFRASAATTSNADVLSASATNGAAVGSYQFTVDRLVSTQQVISASGFTDANTTGANLTSLTFAPPASRLDRDTPLSQLNGGNGIVRGRVQVTDSQGRAATIDLSRVSTVNEALAAFNSNSTLSLKASIDGDRLVIKDLATGSGNLTIAEVGTGTTAASFGIAGTSAGPEKTVTGSKINRIGASTTLSTLNGGLGVAISNAGGTSSPDFKITTRDGRSFDIDLGDLFGPPPSGSAPGTPGPKIESAVSDLAGVIRRIKTQTSDDNFPGGAVIATVTPDGAGIRLFDATNPNGTANFSVTEVGSGTAARDLGILNAGTSGPVVDGRRLIAGLNSTLTRNLNGGQGFAGGAFNVTGRDGSSYSFNIDATDSVSEIISQFNNNIGSVRIRLDDSGTRFIATDASGAGPLTISGSGATALGLTATNATGDVTSKRQNLQIIGTATRLDTLNQGRGVGTGRFEIVNALGVKQSVNINPSDTTIGAVISAINQQAAGVSARINDNGDGILIEERRAPGDPAGANLISIKDVSGNVARNLNLNSTAAAVGTQNTINGSFTKTLTFNATDTLQSVVNAINNAGVSATAAIIADGASAKPFRLSLTARGSGSAGAFSLDASAQSLAFNSLSQAQDARVFFGNSDPAQGLLLTSSTNSVTNAVQGLTINLKTTGANPVTVSVARNNEAITKGVNDFVDTFNKLIDRIDAQSSFDSASNKRGILLGDPNAQGVRQQLLSIISLPPQGVSGRFQTLAQVGLAIGRDGNLTLDSNKLSSALETDPEGVASLFAARSQAATTTAQPVVTPSGQTIPGVTVRNTQLGGFTSLGVLERVAQIADNFIKPIDGSLSRASRTIDNQITAQNSRITAIDTRIASRRTNLQRQFLAMEEAIGKLQGQSSSLSNIRSITR
jgi:flagellar hook-associated protein 2